LNDAGLLGKLDRITGVSGGSILLGVLAHRWRGLDFADGHARNFGSELVQPVQAFCAQTIDVSAGLAGWINPFKSAGDYLIDRYRKDLFGEATLKDLPTPHDGGSGFQRLPAHLCADRAGNRPGAMDRRPSAEQGNAAQESGAGRRWHLRQHGPGAVGGQQQPQGRHHRWPATPARPSA